jgi:hypothetical protein
MGYEAARQKQTEGAPTRLLPILALPVIAHGSYNLLLLTNTDVGVFLAFLLVLFLWVKALGTIKKSRTCS